MTDTFIFTYYLDLEIIKKLFFMFLEILPCIYLYLTNQPVIPHPYKDGLGCFWKVKQSERR